MKWTLLILLLFPVSFFQTTSRKKVNVTEFGARGDGRTDNKGAFEKAIKTADTIVIPKGSFLLKGQLAFNNLRNKTIIATGATILNSDTTVGTLRFDNCSDINVIGGTWTRVKIPVTIGAGGSEHTFTFETVNNIKVENITINGSPQMGICMMNVVGAIIRDNVIQNCFRDGVYAHYSAKLQYINNRLNNIKDDALSIHDYGLMNQKAALLRGGYQQSGDCIVEGNVTSNTYQGFSSIGSKNIVIRNNRFENTVNAGIAVFNSEKMFKGSTARVTHVQIINNILNNNGGTQRIMGRPYINQGQLSSGRCALFVAVNDPDNFILKPVTRLTDVVITNNIITNSRVNGAYLARIDKLVFTDNTFTNTNLDKSIYTRQTIEIVKCTKSVLRNNRINNQRK